MNLGLILLIGGVVLCFASQFALGAFMIIVGIGMMLLNQPTPKQTKKTSSTKQSASKQKTTARKTPVKKEVTPVTGAPAVDAYAYNGSVESYFDALLRGCFSGYEVMKRGESKASGGSTAWECACGAANTGKFCTECGAAKPASDSWTCQCGARNTGRFCSECGIVKPPAIIFETVPTHEPTFTLRRSGRPVLGIHLCGKNEWNSDKVLQTVDSCKAAGFPCLCFYTEFRNEAGYVIDRINGALR